MQLTCTKISLIKYAIDWSQGGSGCSSSCSPPKSKGRQSVSVTFKPSPNRDWGQLNLPNLETIRLDGWSNKFIVYRVFLKLQFFRFRNKAFLRVIDSVCLWDVSSVNTSKSWNKWLFLILVNLYPTIGSKLYLNTFTCQL